MTKFIEKMWFYSKLYEVVHDSEIKEKHNDGFELVNHEKFDKSVNILVKIQYSGLLIFSLVILSLFFGNNIFSAIIIITSLLFAIFINLYEVKEK
jgi:hypothetical protein